MAVFEIGTFSIGSLIGLLIGGFLGHFLAIRRGKGLAKYKAGVEFRKSIFHMKNRLQGGESQLQVVQGEYDNLCDKALDYSGHLDGKSLAKFVEEVDIYKKWREVMYGRNTIDILYDMESPEYLEAKAKNVNTLLDRLLTHAKT